VTNRLGNSDAGKATFARVIETLRSGDDYMEVLLRAMFKQLGRPNGGDVMLLRPDGTEYPGFSVHQ